MDLGWAEEFVLMDDSTQTEFGQLKSVMQPQRLTDRSGYFLSRHSATFIDMVNR